MTLVVPFCITPLALVWSMGSRNIASLIVMVTVRIDRATISAGVRVDTVEAGGAIGINTVSLTVGVLTTFGPGIHLITNCITAVNSSWPVTHRTIRILKAHIENKGPSSLTLGILAECMLTIGTLHKTCFSRRTTLPESAAVCRVLMVVGPLCNGINKL